MVFNINILLLKHEKTIRNNKLLFKIDRLFSLGILFTGFSFSIWTSSLRVLTNPSDLISSSRYLFFTCRFTLVIYCFLNRVCRLILFLGLDFFIFLTFCSLGFFPLFHDTFSLPSAKNTTKRTFFDEFSLLLVQQ